jgi:hypothetical protein
MSLFSIRLYSQEKAGIRRSFLLSKLLRPPKQYEEPRMLEFTTNGATFDNQKEVLVFGRDWTSRQPIA